MDNFLNKEQETLEQETLERYCEIWNKSLKLLQEDFDKDIKEFPNDEHIGFKWGHLMQQEIKMWIRLCCKGEEGEEEGREVKLKQVELEDFNFIINRRGFTPRIINNLKKILSEIGIGEEIKEASKN